MKLQLQMNEAHKMNNTKQNEILDEILEDEDDEEYDEEDEYSDSNSYSNHYHLNKKTVSEPYFGNGRNQFYNNNKKFKKKVIYCSNCKLKGHYQRQCNKPINSYGIICVRINWKSPSNLEYLLIRRRNSIGYETFLRGRYISDEHRKALIDRMTTEEKIALKSKPFDQLWDELCLIKNTKFYKYGKKKAKIKFEQCDIQTLFKDIESKWKLPEWGFPKGRRYVYESDLECATREFCEETNFTPNDFTVLNVPPILETYIATNDIRYIHTYFIAIISPNAPEPVIDYLNHNQITEIGDIGWYTKEECIKLIKPYNMEKKEVLHHVDQILKDRFISNTNQ